LDRAGPAAPREGAAVHLYHSRRVVLGHDVVICRRHGFGDPLDGGDDDENDDDHDHGKEEEEEEEASRDPTISTSTAIANDRAGTAAAHVEAADRSSIAPTPGQ
jgi:hypothetical protein